MSHDRRIAASTDETLGDVELVARLLRSAGPRIEPPPEDHAQVLAAATAAYEHKLLQRRRRRMTIPLALAASLLAAVAGVLWVLRVAPPVQVVARPEALIGEVALRGRHDTLWRPLAFGDEIRADTTIRTGDEGGVALRLAAGPVLRLDADTEVQIESDHRVRLARGAAYVDSGLDASGHDGALVRPVEIATAFATAREVGTQFEMRVLDGRHRLRVREGRVNLAHRHGESSGGPGEQLLVTAEGAVQRSIVMRDDPGWRWVEATAVAPDIENQPLSRVLAWVSRETGRPIRFSSDDIERRTAGAILHGSIRGLPPLAALETVLATSGLRYRISDDGSIVISQG